MKRSFVKAILDSIEISVGTAAITSSGIYGESETEQHEEYHKRVYIRCKESIHGGGGD